MKKALIVSGVAICLMAVFTLRATPNFFGSFNAVFLWEVTSYDFGKIPANKPVTHKFEFTNTGNDPLVIASVQASCGCTVTDYSKDVIEPGGKGYVKATYNAATVGKFNKTVTVHANTEDGTVILTIKGEVVAE